MLSVNVSGRIRNGQLICQQRVAAAASPRGVADLVNISSSRVMARPGTAVYALTKFGVGAFSEPRASCRDLTAVRRSPAAVVDG